MLKFAYKYSDDLDNKNLILKDVLVHKGSFVTTKMNINYYEDNNVININSDNIILEYLRTKNIIIELDYFEEDKIDDIKKKLKDVPSEIEYSIISRGTELSGSKGYMLVSKLIDNKRMLIVDNHGERFIRTYKDMLNCYDYDIYNIAFSRFELISALCLEKYSFDDDILLCGIGDIGVTCLLYLLNKGYKNISIYVRNKKEYYNILSFLNEKYNANINLVYDITGYNTFIDTTGKEEVIKKIFDSISCNNKIFLLGTPRECSFKIDPLFIHRNNLMIVGGHELNGVDREYRNKLFLELLKENMNNEFIPETVKINNYEEEIVKKKILKKDNFIEVIKYDS